MSNEIQFWFDPTTGSVAWTLVAMICLVVLAFSVRLLFLRLQMARREKEFHDLLMKYNLLGKPEEDVLRDMVNKNKIGQPANVLANLQTFDQLASDEIHRTERESLPLSDRIDRIEYLYSIRLQAFAHEPSVGGIGSLLPQSEPVGVPLQGREDGDDSPSGQAAAQELPTASEPQEEDSLNQPETAEGAPAPASPQEEVSEAPGPEDGDNDMAALLGSSDALEPDPSSEDSDRG